MLGFVFFFFVGILFIVKMSLVWVIFFEKEYFWRYLLVFGFELGLVIIVCGKIVLYMYFGV